MIFAGVREPVEGSIGMARPWPDEDEDDTTRAGRSAAAGGGRGLRAAVDLDRAC